MRVVAGNGRVEEKRPRVRRCDPVTSPRRVNANERFAIARPAERVRHRCLAPVLLTRDEARRAGLDGHENHRGAVARILPLGQQRASVRREGNRSPLCCRLRRLQRPGHNLPSGPGPALDRRVLRNRDGLASPKPADLRSLARPPLGRARQASVGRSGRSAGIPALRRRGVFTRPAPGDDHRHERDRWPSHAHDSSVLM